MKKIKALAKKVKSKIMRQNTTSQEEDHSEEDAYDVTNDGNTENLDRIEYFGGEQIIYEDTVIDPWLSDRTLNLEELEGLRLARENEYVLDPVVEARVKKNEENTYEALGHIYENIPPKNLDLPPPIIEPRSNSDKTDIEDSVIHNPDGEMGAVGGIIQSRNENIIRSTSSDIEAKETSHDTVKAAHEEKIKKFSQHWDAVKKDLEEIDNISSTFSTEKTISVSKTLKKQRDDIGEENQQLQENIDSPIFGDFEDPEFNIDHSRFEETGLNVNERSLEKDNTRINQIDTMSAVGGEGQPEEGIYEVLNEENMDAVGGDSQSEEGIYEVLNEENMDAVGGDSQSEEGIYEVLNEENMLDIEDNPVVEAGVKKTNENIYDVIGHIYENIPSKNLDLPPPIIESHSDSDKTDIEDSIIRNLDGERGAVGGSIQSRDENIIRSTSSDSADSKKLEKQIDDMCEENQQFQENIDSPIFGDFEEPEFNIDHSLFEGPGLDINELPLQTDNTSTTPMDTYYDVNQIDVSEFFRLTEGGESGDVPR